MARKPWIFHQSLLALASPKILDYAARMSLESVSELTSSDAVFDALGGVPGVMEVTGARYKTVHMWKAAKSFPSATYVLMTDELSRRGYRASPDLWDMKQRAAG